MRRLKKVVLIFIHVASIIFGVCDGHEYNPEGWNVASEYILENLDQTVNPCDNFYAFVCGNQLSKENDTHETPDFQLAQKGENYVHELMKDSLSHINESNPNYAQWLKIFYDKCVEQPYTSENDFLRDINENLAEHFIPSIVEVIHGLENPETARESFWKFVGHLQRQQNSKFLISATVEISEINCVRKPLLHIYPGPYSDANVAHFAYILLARIFNVTDLNESEINKTINELSHLQKDLRKLHYKLYYLETMELTQNKVKIAELYKIAPNVSWHSYFQGLLPADLYESWSSSDPDVVIVDQEYFQKLSLILSNYTFDTQVNMAYTLLVYDLFKLFKVETVANAQEPTETQEEICMELTYEFFGPAAASLLINATYATNAEEWKYDVEIITEAVISAFRFLVNGLDWVDYEDKMTLMKKINAISLQTGIPDWLKFEHEIEIRTPQFDSNLNLLANYIVTQQRSFLQYVKPLFGATLLEDLSPNFKNKAYYSQFTINVLFGLLISPLYTYMDPLAMKFGAVGWTVARELLRAFDDVHLLEAPEGVEKWLKNDTLAAFHNRKDCLVEKYANSCRSVQNRECPNTRSINELILNSEALKVAYTAYRFSTQTLGREPPLPKLVKYSGDQLFLISAGQTFCVSWTKDADFFANIPAEDKVKYTIENSPIFAKIFGCTRKPSNERKCGAILPFSDL